MSKAAELIADLQSTAKLDSEGGFTLDREKARQKMRQFQLADPHRYVLLLVECAALRGAKTIEFEIDADDMRMRTDAVLEYEDLDELYTSLFVDRSGLGIRSRRELALACNAVMALNPKFVEIVSNGSMGTCVKGLLRPDEPDVVGKVEATGPTGTLIHVKERFRPGLLVRFLRDSQGTLPEELLLRERCSYSSISIVLDGKIISDGLPKHLIAATPFETEDLRGIGGVDPNQLDRSGVVLISNGVEIATHELRDSVPGLWFWVDGRALRKDVSQNDIARGDAGYGAMLKAIAGVRDRVLGQLAESWLANKFSVDGKPSRDDVFRLLSRCFMRWADKEWLRPDAGPLGRLADLPVWRTTTETWMDSRAVASQANPERGIVYSMRTWDGVVPEGWGPVLHPWSGEEEVVAIKRVFVEARDVTSELGRRKEAELARRAWRARPHEPLLPQGHWPVRLPFSSGEHRGELSARPGRRANVRVIVDGCMLHEVEFEGLLDGLTAVLEGPYAPLADYSRAQLDATWATGLLALLAHVPALLEGWVQVHGREAAQFVRSWLVALSDPAFPTRWLEAFGFKGASTMVARLGAPPLLPRLAVDHPQPTVIAQILEFETLDRRKVSLVELERERHAREYQRGKLLIVNVGAPTLTEVQVLAVRATPEDRRLLGAIFGEGSLHDDSATLQRQLARQEFQRRPTAAPMRPQPSTCAIEIQQDDVQGFVAIDAAELRRPDAPRTAAIDVLFENRLLGQLRLPAPLAGVRASLSWPSATVDSNWTGVVGSRLPLSKAIDHGLFELIREQVERCIELQSRPAGDVRRLIWAAMVAPFPNAELFATWRWHRQHAPDLAAAIAGYVAVLELMPKYFAEAVSEGLSLLRSDDREPTAAALTELLGQPKQPNAVGASGDFQRRLLELMPRLEVMPMFETASRRTVALAQVTPSFDKSGNVAWIQDPGLATTDDEELILRVDVDDRTKLEQLFGDDALVEASARLRELQQRQQFTSRKPLERIELDEPNRMIVVDFSGDGFEGQLAIPPWVPDESAVMSVTLCHERRPIEAILLHAVLPVVGIVDDARPDFEQQFIRFHRGSARMAALRKRLDEVLQGELLPRVAATFTGLMTSNGRAIAWAWITRWWLRCAEGAGDHPERLGELGRTFAALPGFVDIDGQPRSLDELISRYQAEGTLYTLDPGSTRNLPTSEPVLLMRSEDRLVLPRLFDKITDYAPLLKDAIEGHERHRKAPEPPPRSSIPDPSAVLQRVDLDQHGLEGALWLPAQFPFDAGVVMVSRGRIVERSGLASSALVDELPIQGLVLGEVASDRRFSKAELGADQRRYLVGRVINAYSQLVNQYRHELEHPDRVDVADREQARRRAVRIDILRRAAVALAQSHRRGVPQDAIKANLRERLCDVPLLRLSTGRLVSINVAEEVRPIELNHLELWEPRDPASEQFESQLFGALAEAGRQAAAKAEAEPEPEPATEDDVRRGLALFAALLGDGEPKAKAKAKAQPHDPIDVSALDPAPDPVVPIEPPAPPPPDPVDVLLDAIREELRLVRKGQESLLAEGLLDKIRAEAGKGRGPLVKIDGAVVFDSKHRCFVQALEQPEDPVWVSFLASVAYTALNHWQEQVSDADELSFHARHAAMLASAVLVPASH
jgi:hypothetical protein